MEFGEYSIKYDKTGFPLITKQGWSFYISLFPVSKYQFERFLVTSGPVGEFYTDRWYRDTIQANPRNSWKNTGSFPWRLFLTGVTSEELAPFFSYLGDGFRLPQKKEWLALYKSEQSIHSLKQFLLEDFSGNKKCATPVAHWLNEDLFPLTGEGVLEMIHDEDRVRFTGKPFNLWHNNLYDPTSVRDIPNSNSFKTLGGSRVVCPLL